MASYAIKYSWQERIFFILAFSLILFACFTEIIVAQDASDTANLHMKDVSILSMVDTLEYYDENLTDSIMKVSGGTASILASESTFTNWASGGQNSVTGIGKVRLYSNKRKHKNYYGHTLNAALGYIGASGEFRKTEDRLDYYFKYSRYLKKKKYLSMMLSFKTQMIPGYNYPNDSVKISNFMAPGYIMLKVGVDYMPNRKIKIFVAPLSSKITMVADKNLANKGAFGVVQGTFDAFAQTFLSMGENLRYEFGGYVVLSFKGDITKMLRLETELDLFSNYKNNPQNIDVDWQLEAKLKISKVFSVNFESHLIYDDDIKTEVDEAGTVLQGPKVQFKQFLGLGVSFAF